MTIHFLFSFQMALSAFTGLLEMSICQKFCRKSKYKLDPPILRTKLTKRQFSKWMYLKTKAYKKFHNSYFKYQD